MERGVLSIAFTGHWVETHDADPAARRLYRRHYSCRHYRDGRIPKKFVGPGEHIVLITPDGLALFVWRKFISDDGQTGVNCAVFRNEGPILSSTLIREAEEFAWRRAGWRRCGETQRGLIVLEKWPDPEE